MTEIINFNKHTTAIGVTDTDIIVSLQYSSVEGWSMLYDKYCGALYGIFCRSYDNTGIAEAEFIKCFLELQNKKAELLLQEGLAIFLIRHASVYIRNSTGKNQNFSVAGLLGKIA